MRHAFSKGILVALLVATTGCARNDAPPVDASVATAVAEPKPAPSRALAEATTAAGTLHVAVLQAKRTQDIVRVELAFIYLPLAGAGAPPTQTSQAPPAPEPLSLLRALGAIADASADANPADFCLLTADGARRLFLMHDAQGKPVLEGDWQRPLRPAERRVLAATFPAPPPPREALRVTLLLGRLVMRDVPIS
jgi:hypothetical protein